MTPACVATGGEVAWLAMHKAWIRFGHAREAAAALIQAIPAESGADCTRQVRERATSMNKTCSWSIICPGVCLGNTPGQMGTHIGIHACNGVGCACG
jgi:hypothetical protein